jgi:plant G-box-binding factor
VLNEENTNLRAEINKLKSQCEELTTENTSLKDQLSLFPPLEGISMDNDHQEPDTNQTGAAERKVDSYKDST